MELGDGSVMLQIVAALIAAGAVYGGIRSDLKAIHEQMMRIEQMAVKAHDRLDRVGIGRGARRSDEDQ